MSKKYFSELLLLSFWVLRETESSTRFGSFEKVDVVAQSWSEERLTARYTHDCVIKILNIFIVFNTE